MSKLRISFTLVDNLTASAREVNGRLSSILSRVGGIDTNTARVGGMNTALMRQGGLSCRMWKVVDITPPAAPYLEIEPTIVWILDGWTSNDVYSNTTWGID